LRATLSKHHIWVSHLCALLEVPPFRHPEGEMINPNATNSIVQVTFFLMRNELIG
jgi:hypothetical protein